VIGGISEKEWDDREILRLYGIAWFFNGVRIGSSSGYGSGWLCGDSWRREFNIIMVINVCNFTIQSTQNVKIICPGKGNIHLNI
jgi:hypothetical protein